LPCHYRFSGILHNRSFFATGSERSGAPSTPIEALIRDGQDREVVTYQPVEDYGGCIRLTKRGRAYIASGDRGVRLFFAKGGGILIGSQQPERLAQAIAAARSGA
jgi:hypothetical protein